VRPAGGRSRRPAQAGADRTRFGRALGSPRTDAESQTTQTLGVIGVPTSAAAFAPGQELAPAALRDAGLPARLSEQGFEVRDHGDREVWRWRPDRGQRRAQNASKVAEIVRETAQRVGRLRSSATSQSCTWYPLTEARASGGH